ncbi:WxL domain-containing protein, partial [Enterococcus faecalis]
NGLKLGTESLQGNIKVALITQLDLEYEATSNSYVALTTAVSTPEVRPQLAAPQNWTLDLGGEAQLMANAAAGQGQGLW